MDYNRTEILLWSFFLPKTTERKLCGQDKAHALHLPGVDGPALHGVDAGGVDAGVSQNVRQPGQILFQRVIAPGEQVAQVVGNTLPGSTPALSHRRFMSRQMLERSRGLPVRVVNTGF